MSIPLRILHLEDNPADAELVRALLEADGISCTITCVKERSEFETALDEDAYDLIISDYSLPTFDGLAALAIARERRVWKPLIFVSGTMGEEAAVESLKRGATDYVLKDRLGRLAAAVRRAVSEAEEAARRRELEAQLLRAQRLETIGALAGGIAHDLNNTLAPVLLGVHVLEREIGSPQSRAVLEAMRASTLRATEMIRQILAFARGVGGEPAVLDLGRLIAETEKLVRETFPRSIHLQSRVAPQLYPFLGNATQLHQVLLNLCVNARDAMPAGGLLRLQVENVLIENKITPWQPEPVSGRYVMLTVSDSGHGMSPEVLARIFEPFFTTKEPGKGTGLGLSTVQGIVKSHGGFLDVASAPSEGTTFKVYLPAVTSAQASTP